MLCDHRQFLLNLEGVKLQCLEIATKLVEKLHTFFITWGDGGVRYYVSSILVTLINYY